MRVEWPTFLVLAGCYAVWAAGTTVIYAWSPMLAILVTAIAIAQFSSLQHEALHGHPFRWRWLNEALVFPGLTIFIPYVRFRDLHLAHHHDANLTDPYDDPETNYLDPAVWRRLGAFIRSLLKVNNTMLGRMMLGPIISQIYFMRSDWRAIMQGDRAVLAGWLWHVPAVMLVLIWLWQFASMPVWTYLIAAYLGASILKIRTFLEHQAHEKVRGRTVIIEDRGPLALLFLNNNLHVVHHMHPQVPWYELPGEYRADKVRYREINENYVFHSYAEIFRKFMLRRKDPVPHPLWPTN